MARGDRGMERAVRVFTVCNESRYIVVRNMPALAVVDDLLKRLSLYGKVCEYRVLDHASDRAAAIAESDGDDNNDKNGAGAGRGVLSDRDHEERFTDVVLVQYETVNNARHAKARAVQKPFFGSMLRITYAPQYETRQDTLLKFTQRRELLQRRARVPTAVRLRLAQPRQPEPTHQVAVPTQQMTSGGSNEEFIGPQLPTHEWRRPPAPPSSLAPVAPLRVPHTQPEPSTTKRRRI